MTVDETSRNAILAAIMRLLVKENTTREVNECLDRCLAVNANRRNLGLDPINLNDVRDEANTYL